MPPLKVPVIIPRYVIPVRVDCECRRAQVDLEYKFVTLQWAIGIGQSVKKEDVICEGEVEKVFFEIHSPIDGILSEISTPDGETCDIHNPIGYIEAL